MNSAELNIYNNRLEKLDIFFKKNDTLIENIIEYWQKKSLDCDIYINHPELNFFKIPNKEIALNHYKIVELYNCISNHNPKYLADWKTYNNEYNNFNHSFKHFSTMSERNNNLLEFGNKIILDQNISYDFNTLYQDFCCDRKIISNIFKNIFCEYGIKLNDKALEMIFGKLRISHKGYIDSLSMITYKTYFEKPLKNQFDVAISGHAKGIFSAFFMRSAGMLQDNNNYSNFGRSTPVVNNPFIQERRIIKMFAKAEFLTKKILEKKGFT